VLRLSSISKKPDGGLAVVTGEGHKFVQNQSFLLAAGLKVSGPPEFHRLGYPGLSSRFLLLSVTQFMRNRSPFRNSFNEATRLGLLTGFCLCVINNVERSA